MAFKFLVKQKNLPFFGEGLGKEHIYLFTFPLEAADYSNYNYCGASFSYDYLLINNLAVWNLHA
jgi:hypothetical protein